MSSSSPVVFSSTKLAVGIFRRRPLPNYFSSSSSSSSSTPPSAGFFDLLPLEVKHNVFSFLSFETIGTLALTCETLRVITADYSRSHACLRRVRRVRGNLDDDDDDDDDGGLNAGAFNSEREREFALRRLQKEMRSSRGFAVLCKRHTCLLNSKERIAFAMDVFDKVISSAAASSPAAAHSSNDLRLTLDTAQFFDMFHQFTRGWDECEFVSLLNAVEKKYALDKHVTDVLEAANACKTDGGGGGGGGGDSGPVDGEMQIRLVLRCLTWEFAGKDFSHRAAWLLSLLRRYANDSPRSQAVLLYTVFGPACEDGRTHYDHPQNLSRRQLTLMENMFNHADWDVFTLVTPIDFHHGKSLFYHLAQAVCCCLSHSSDWSERKLHKVLDDLFRMPKAWKWMNVAGFLLFCSERLILDYLKKKLDTGLRDQIALVGKLMVDMIIVSYRFENHLSPERGIGKILDILCCYPESNRLRTMLHSLFLESLFQHMNSQSSNILSAGGNVDDGDVDVDEEELKEVFRDVMLHVTRRAYFGRRQDGQQKEQEQPQAKRRKVVEDMDMDSDDADDDYDDDSDDDDDSEGDNEE